MVIRESRRVAIFCIVTGLEWLLASLGGNASIALIDGYCGYALDSDCGAKRGEGCG